MKLDLTQERYFGLGQVPKGIGAVLDGWNILEEDFKNPLITKRTVDLRVMTEKCLRNCFFCFTDKPKKILSLHEIKNIIDQLSEMKIRSINYLGEGEPTLDEDFFEIIEYTANKQIQPIIFTDGASKLTDINFIKKLKEIGATVCPKCDSLYNAEYQNRVVGDKTGTFFDQRNEALKLLIQEGFNEVREDGTTRLGFDMVISKRNMDEVAKTLRYCRDNNMRIVFSFYLPSGRSIDQNFDKENLLSEEEKSALRDMIKKIDSEEYGLNHHVGNNFFTMPCVEFIQVFGNGDVSPCPGNPNVVGNIKDTSLQEIKASILTKYPKHNCETFDGNCLYRKPII